LRRRGERALAELGAAAPLVAVGLLVVNDHRWKGQFHNALTGKLSDIAICFLLPLLLSAASGIVCDWPGRRRLVAGAVLTTLVFTVLELSDPAGALFVRAMNALGLHGTLTRDPTDLLALGCVPLALAYGRQRLAVAEHGPNIWRSATGALVMVTGLLALMADEDNVRAKPCDKPLVPVTFQAEAGCGPGGQILVQRSTDLSNAAALGLPPASSDNCESVSGGFLGDSVKGDGGMCPIGWDQGSWEFTVSKAVDYDGGILENCNCSGGCGVVTLETCSAVFTNGGGTFTCQPSDGGALCTSHLTVVPDGGGSEALNGTPPGTGVPASAVDAAASE
jgi:hypothetical protein